MKIVIGSDHAGFLRKEEVKEFLKEKGYEVIDVGTNSTESCNYAEFALKAAEMVGKHEVDLGVLVCSSGEGISIAANKVKGVRCGIGYNDDVSHLLREHNDANMIAFGASFMDKEEVLKRVQIFLNASFQGGRHEKRVNTIKDYEK